MRNFGKILLLSAILSFATPMSSAMANDSAAAIGLGGLEHKQSNDISMDSEDLYISREEIRVKYRFTNHSNKDVTTLISFPLPPLPLEDHFGNQNFSDWKELEFKTKVNGKPIELTRIDRVYDGDGKDVTAKIERQGWPLFYWNEGDLNKRINSAPAAVKEEYLQAGLLAKENYGAEDTYYPIWKVQTHITRDQTFPAGKTVTVEHSYKPVTGGTVAGGLERQYRTDDSDYLKEYCVDKSFLAGFDKRRYQSGKDKNGGEIGQYYVEHWVDYVLSSGANWKGPIKDFRLVIDKGKATNLVSLCMNGVKKISPTQFEVRKTNFEPKKDLNILIVEWFRPEE